MTDELVDCLVIDLYSKRCQLGRASLICRSPSAVKHLSLEGISSFVKSDLDPDVLCVLLGDFILSSVDWSCSSLVSGSAESIF